MKCVREQGLPVRTFCSPYGSWVTYLGKALQCSACLLLQRLTLTRMRVCTLSQSPSNPLLVGNLFIIIDIEFPNSISPEVQSLLKAHLPNTTRPPPLADGEAEHHTLVEMDPVESFRSTDIPDDHAGDEDDEEGHGGVHQAQCAQQ